MDKLYTIYVEPYAVWVARTVVRGEGIVRLLSISGALHYLLPFIIAALSVLHLGILHVNGSGNPIGINTSLDKIRFFPYLLSKDRVGLIALLIVLALLISYAPNYLGHPDNYVKANNLVTPLHIQPESYVLSVYCILRSIPNKTGGVIALALVFLSLGLLPYLNTSKIRSSHFRPLYKKFLFGFFASFILLTWGGAKPVEDPYVFIGQLATLYFFAFMWIVIPVLGRLEFEMLTGVMKKIEKKKEN